MKHGEGSCSHGDPRVPVFIIIGAAKSGTTTLYEYLRRHRDIFMCAPKEPEFFARDARYALGLTWYRSLFHLAAPHQRCGESSTAYARWPHFGDVSGRMCLHVPNVKLIYIVRHPVDRAYSDYVQQVKTARNVGDELEAAVAHLPANEREVYRRICAADRAGTVDWTGARFEDVVEATDRIVDTGRYMSQIEQYLKHFAREQMLLLLFEELCRDPVDLCRRVLRFIGVDLTKDMFKGSRIVANAAYDHHSRMARLRVADRVRSMPLARRTLSLLPQSWKEAALRAYEGIGLARQTFKQVVPPPMLGETRMRLVEFYREPNRALADFLGRDLSDWDQ